MQDRPLDRRGSSRCCLCSCTSNIRDLKRDYGICVIGIRIIVCCQIADCGDQCICCVTALQTSRIGELEDIRTVVQFQVADIIPADNEIELVVCNPGAGLWYNA